MGTSNLKRSVLLIVTAIQVGLVSIGLGIFGLRAVNIDSLQQHPVLFSLFLIAPAAGACLTAILAVVPRIVQINLIIFALLWLVAEVIFGVINPSQREIEKIVELTDQPYYVDNTMFGYEAGRNSVARHTEFQGRRQLYTVTYWIDAFGRRVTPVDSQGTRSKFLLFFGDSNTFGYGLEQRETLPYYAGDLIPDYQPYNYAFEGWGPAQMLELMKMRNIPAEIKQKTGYAIFFFIEDHIARSIGSSQVSTEWGQHFPYYILDAKSNLVRHGNFATDRPLTTLWYYLLMSSNVTKYFGLVLPRHYSDEDYRLTAEIMRQSQQILQKEFKLEGMYIVISPAFDERELGVYRRFMEELKKVRVEYLDYTRLYDTQDVRYRESDEDYHNSALANRLIAAAIAKDLGIGQGAKRKATKTNAMRGGCGKGVTWGSAGQQGTIEK